MSGIDESSAAQITQYIDLFHSYGDCPVGALVQLARRSTASSSDLRTAVQCLEEALQLRANEVASFGLAAPEHERMVQALQHCIANLRVHRAWLPGMA